MLNIVKSVAYCSARSFKNFGHKRERIPAVTVLWQGFLTFSFIGLGLEWKTIARLFFGDEDNTEEELLKGNERSAAADSISVKDPESRYAIH